MEGMALQSATILNLGGWGVTNSILSALTVTVLIVVLIFSLRGGFKLIPGRMQQVFELITLQFMGYLKVAYGSEQLARRYLPFYLSLFLFILLANQFTVIPLVGSLIHDGQNLFRTATSDWSGTIALALICLSAAHVMAFSISPLKHLGNYIKLDKFWKARSFSDFGGALLDNVIALLDVIGEVAKLVSLSARLFGNIFAGEVMIAVISAIAFFTSYIFPLPFLALSIFSGVVQAFVFTLLSLNFMSGTINSVKSN